MGECNGCGTCCKALIIPCKDYDEQFLRMRRNFVRVFDYRGEKYLYMESVCRYLSDENKCLIYTKRPPVCKFFPEKAEAFWFAAYPDCGYNDKKDEKGNP